VARTGDGFALVTEAKFYDRHGEKDEREEVISRHATLEAAAAAFDAYPARAQAVAA
jgi:hypothetical protein